METIYGLAVNELQPISSLKEKNIHWIKVGTPDNKFIVKYCEEYACNGVHVYVKLLWYGILPYYLTPDQKTILAEAASNVHFSKGTFYNK